ncbi:hypothetical protein M5K25_000197 [Dendrobium thyrsiflorum]|uniref:Uncharacterized protein n=1 Tax=Dendrobium thyrsiflorum TaxID=117978 RepID=A0ABD0VUS1_DENTH
MTVLESNLLGQNSIYSILRLSYIVLPNHLKNCFAFCCIFPQGYRFDKDDLVRRNEYGGFRRNSKKSLFDMIGDLRYYKMHDLIHESASNFFARECSKVVDDEKSSLKISKTIRYLYVETRNLDTLRKIEKFEYLHSLFLFSEDSN